MDAQRTELRGHLDRELGDVRKELLDVKASVLRVENELTTRMADLQTRLQTGMNRWAIAMATGNAIAVVTALVA